MKFLTYSATSLIAVLGAFAALAACGSSSNGGTGSSVPCNTRALADCDQEVTCSQTKCSAELKTCFGADYKSGTCGTYLQCINACACNDNACTTACGAPSQACQACVSGTLGDCEQTNGCAALCNSGTAGSGAGGSSGSGAGGSAGSGGNSACAQLANCCPGLPTAEQSLCMQAVSNGSATTCAQYNTAFCSGAGGSGAGGAGGSGAGGASGSGAGATAGVGAGGTGGTVAACTQLNGCCPTLASALQPYCATIVQYNDAATCSQFYSLECVGGGAGGSSGAGAGGSGGTGASWVCQPAGTGSCACVQGAPASDTCTSKPACCVSGLIGGYPACVCESPTDLQGATCAQIAAALAVSVVATCPPN